MSQKDGMKQSIKAKDAVYIFSSWVNKLIIIT